MEALPSTAPRGAGSGLVREVRGAPVWARRVVRRPGKGHPTQAGSAERSVGDREGRAHGMRPSSQPLSLALGFSGDPPHSPATSGRPRPSFPPRPTFARSSVLALVPGLPSWAPAPRSPPPSGRGPFHNSATRLPSSRLPVRSRPLPSRRMRAPVSGGCGGGSVFFKGKR